MIGARTTFTALALLGLTGNALAEPASSSPRSTEQASVAPRSGDYLHDGFFMRGAVFGGHMHDEFESDRNSFFGLSSGTTNGLALGFELALGGAISPGWMLAGGILTAWTPGPSADLLDEDPFHEVEIESQSLYALVAVFDVYLDPSGGLFGEVGAGLAFFDVAQAHAAGDYHSAQGSTGYVLLGGLGWDAWSTEQHSAGVLLRGMVGRFDGADHGQSSVTGTRKHKLLVAPMIMGTFAYD